jgi:hypothetical protein
MPLISRVFLNLYKFVEWGGISEEVTLIRKAIEEGRVS